MSEVKRLFFCLAVGGVSELVHGEREWLRTGGSSRAGQQHNLIIGSGGSKNDIHGHVFARFVVTNYLGASLFV